MRRLARWVAPMLAVAVGAAALWSIATEESAYARSLQNVGPVSSTITGGPLEVVGDSTTYYYRHYTLPSSWRDSTAAMFEADQDTVIFDVRSCSSIRLLFDASADTFVYKLEYSYDSKTWTKPEYDGTNADSVIVYGTQPTDFPPAATSFNRQINRRFIRDVVIGLNKTQKDMDYDYALLRVIFRNMDVDSVASADSALVNAAADTMFNQKWTVICGD